MNTDSLNERQKRFCEAYVRQPVGRYAALEAGYAPGGATVQAYRLLEQPRIRARIDALRADVAARNCLNKDTILSKLEAIYEGALASHQFHAAVRAVELQVRLSQMIQAGENEGITLHEAPGGEQITQPAQVQPALTMLRTIAPIAPIGGNANRCIPMLTEKGGVG